MLSARKTKIIAYYLPQYHEIPENNEWWGKGFTEWTNVKNAKPVFKGHIQPKIPLDKNYYNLLDKKTVEWQTNLMNQYGIYGFCYFHYWFKHGKKILEKPAENLLKWKDINQKFCFFGQILSGKEHGVLQRFLQLRGSMKIKKILETAKKSFWNKIMVMKKIGRNTLIIVCSFLKTRVI